jgi:tetratricopeptide (TPR) repeat protein
MVNRICLIAFFAVGWVKCAQTPQKETQATPSNAGTAAKTALGRGQEELRAGDVARARSEFEKAVKLAPRDAEAQSELGWLLAQQGRSVEAERGCARHGEDCSCQCGGTLRSGENSQPAALFDEVPAGRQRAVKLAPERADFEDDLGTLWRKESMRNR